MESKKEIVLGHITNIQGSILEPIKMENIDMNLRSIMILVGANGVGKSFIMKLVWIFATQMNNIAASRKFSMPYLGKEGLQEIFDNSIKDNTVTANLTVSYTDGDYISIDIEGGKIKRYDVSLREEVVPQGAPMYLSKDTRLISDLTKYIMIKNMMSITNIANKADFDKLNQMYPLYDILFLEKQISILKGMTSSLVDKINDTMKNFDDKMDNIISIRLDEAKGDVLYATTEFPERSMTTLGAGHQSLFTMFLQQV